MKLMKHVKKFLTTLVGVLAVGLIVIIFLVSNKTEEVTNPTIAIPSNGPISALEYQSEAKQAMTDYELFLQDQISIDVISDRKQHLLELKISKEFQGLHLQLVTIADSLLAFNKGQVEEKNQATKLLSELYSQYSWLTN